MPATAHRCEGNPISTPTAVGRRGFDGALHRRARILTLKDTMLRKWSRTWEERS
jgi:hypothetical protein